MNRVLVMCCFVGLFGPTSLVAESKPDPPDYDREIAPIFGKYCNGCHNAEEANGELVLTDYRSLLRGGENGPVIVPGRAEKSRLMLQLERKAEPFMPPEGEKGPSADEIALLRDWIVAGAKASPAGTSQPERFVTPQVVVTVPVRKPIQALAVSPDGRWTAVARAKSVELLKAGEPFPVHTLQGQAGHINDVGFSADGRLLFVAAGEPGLYGECQLWNTEKWTLLRTLRGHRDCLYAAAVSPDGKTLATGSYDQKIILWNVADGQPLRTLTGHNGPVFDLAFHRDGKLLASASGDRTVKLWDVATGTRLDTLSQPEKDQHTVAFSPDGRFLAAGGADNRIRVWELRLTGGEDANPLVYSRFAHEGAILKLVFSPNGDRLVSSGEDRRLKVWEAQSFTWRNTLDPQPDFAAALAFSGDDNILVGRLDGSFSRYVLEPGTIAEAATSTVPTEKNTVPASPESDAGRQSVELTETEPNDDPQHVSTEVLSAPATVAGLLSSPNGNGPDVDLHRFSAKAGETLVIETAAASKESPADTRIEVLHHDGKPVMRLMLQAVRDSYITFRPVDSSGLEIRVKNWEEMALNQFVYMGGEVCKIFRMPRGPDSGINCYAVNGKRRNYFDTSATIHALDAPAYIVEPYPTGTKPKDNGLPAFPLYYANDDDGERKLGADSKLRFTAPADGTYFVRVTDVRGFGGDDFKYWLTIRRPRPDFQVTVDGKNPKISPGSGQRITFKLDRKDGFDGDVRVDAKGLPPGFRLSTPTVIQASHSEAQATLHAEPDAAVLTKEQWSQIKLTATAIIHGSEVAHEVGDLGEIKLGDKPKLIVHLETDQPSDSQGTAPSSTESQELIIAPGTTITARMWIERDDFDGVVRIDVDNLPHGVIVDNLGLNGITLLEGETERQIFLTAADWVAPTNRQIHAVSQTEGKQASLPISLRVRSSKQVAQTTE